MIYSFEFLDEEKNIRSYGERAGVDSPSSPHSFLTAALSTLRWLDKETKLRFFILLAPSHLLLHTHNIFSLSLRFEHRNILHISVYMYFRYRSRLCL